MSRPDVNTIFARHNHPTSWFEDVYATANQNPERVPWVRLAPNPNLVAWQQREQYDGSGKRALVIGCGLGDDAEFIAAQMGCNVTAFDISETAIAWCKRRWQNSAVDYIVTDLLHPPERFAPGYDFVFEAYTVQALPLHIRARALRAVARTVAPGGDLLLICRGRDDDTPVGDTPPWAVSREELAALETAGLETVAFEDYFGAYTRRFRGLYTRQG